jgi:hypothetical protein
MRRDGQSEPSRAMSQSIQTGALENWYKSVSLDYETGHRVLVMLLGVSAETDSVEDVRITASQPLPS